MNDVDVVDEFVLRTAIEWLREKPCTGGWTGPGIEESPLPPPWPKQCLEMPIDLGCYCSRCLSLVGLRAMERGEE